MNIIITHLNICARDDSSLMLNMALLPASICSSMNSYGADSIIEHMATEMQFVTKAVLSSMNRHSVKGRIANGSVNTLISPYLVIMPTSTGNSVADIIVNMNLLAFWATSLL